MASASGVSSPARAYRARINPRKQAHGHHPRRAGLILAWLVELGALVRRDGDLAPVEALERLAEAVHRVDDVVAVGLAFEREADRGHLTREELRVGERARVHLAVALRLLAVAVGLAVLGEQDQRCRVRRLGGEHQVQEDERVRVPAQRDGCGVEDDPEHDEDRLSDEVAAGAEEAGGAFGEARERVRVVRGTAGRAARGCEVVAAGHQRLAWVTRQSAGSTRSRTSSIVTAPTSRPAPSVTGTATTS